MVTAVPKPPTVTVIARIVEWIESTYDTAFPAGARDSAVQCIFDLFGCAAAGYRDRGPSAVRSTTFSMFGSGDIPVWFSGKASSILGAAFANSTAAASLDMDDGHHLARGHPGAAVIPAVLAIGQEINATTEEIISAIIVGYEVGITVSHGRLTYGNSGTWSSYAVVAAAGYLRRTPAGVLAHALAIAGETSPNMLFFGARAKTPVPEGCDVKEGIPWSVVTGLVALDLAIAGHTGPRNILDSIRHYQFSDDLPLGQWCIQGTYFKPYTCCRHIHAPLDALSALIEKHSIEMGSITSIVVSTNRWAHTLPNSTNPQNLLDIQYSIPACMALVALRGPESLLPLTAEALLEDGLRLFAEKVAVKLDDRIEEYAEDDETWARVAVSTFDSEYISERTGPRGGGKQPLGWDGLEQKLRVATRLVLARSEQDSFVHALKSIAGGELEPLHAALQSIIL